MRIAAIGALVLAVATGGCLAEDELGEDQALLSENSSEHGTWIDLATGEEAPGKVKIKRGDESIAVKLAATASPGAVVTLWACGANNPDACANGPDACSIPDIMGNADAEGFCYWGGTGAIADADGVVEMAADVPVGSYPGEVLFGDPIADGHASLLGVLLHEHGQPIPELLEEMLTTFSGGCPPNECVTTQAALFQGW